LIYERRVAFDDDSFKGGCLCGYGSVVFGWNGVRVEEAAGVIELDLAGRWELRECMGDLRRDDSCWHGFREGVFPEIAHDAAEGALAVGQEDGGYWDGFVFGGEFVFDEESEGVVRIECGSIGALGDDPVVACRGCGWVEGLHKLREFRVV
jgi:hypothetical protein